MRTSVLSLAELEERLNLRKDGKASIAKPRERIFPGDGSPLHGTMNGYSMYGCRCELCESVGKPYARERSRRRRREFLDGVVKDNRNTDPNIISSSYFDNYTKNDFRTRF
jgi:hypothetical protein